MTTADLMLQWYTEVWNNSNDALIDELMDKEVIVHGLDPSGMAKGIANFKTYYHNLKASFPFIHIEAKTLVYNEEVATVHCTVTGTSPDGAKVAFPGISVGRFENGKIAETWNTFDFLKMHQQLGHILVSAIKEN